MSGAKLVLLRPSFFGGGGSELSMICGAGAGRSRLRRASSSAGLLGRFGRGFGGRRRAFFGEALFQFAPLAVEARGFEREALLLVGARHLRGAPLFHPRARGQRGDLPRTAAIGWTPVSRMRLET